MAPNPNPQRITSASWWLMEELLKLQPGSRNGGIFANKPGYHGTRAGNFKTNYSVVDDVDKKGPSDKAAAYDWTFPSAQAGDYRQIERYTDRLMASAKDQNDPRLNGWREFYGQADADRDVEGWDTRYNKPSTSDPSHLWHLHFSETRGLVESYDNKRALLSVLRGETVAEWRNQGGTGVATDDVKQLMLWDPNDDTGIGNWKWRADFATNKTVQYRYAIWLGPEEAHGAKVAALATQAAVVSLEVQVRGLIGVVNQLLARELGDDVLTPEQFAELKAALLGAVEEASAPAREVAAALAAAGEELARADGE